MSTPIDNHFLVVAPDVPQAEREKYKAAHIKYAGRLAQDGYLVTGGALLPEGKLATEPDVLNKLAGSFLIIKADSREEVLEKLKGDLYYHTGEVWDQAKLQITSIFLAGAPKTN